MTVGGRTLAALLLALTVAGPTAAQERDREARDQTPRDTAAQDTLPRDTVVARQPGLGYRPADLSIAVMAGLPGGGEAQNHPVRLWRTDLAGAVLDSAVLSRTVELRGGVYGGVSGALGLGRDWAVRLGLGITTGTLEASYDGTDPIFVTSANAVAGNTADLEIVTLESVLQYRIPSTRRIQPYLELGGAISRWTAEGSLREAAALRSGVTRFEVLAGVGGIIPITRRFSARIHAAQRLFRTPVPIPAVGDTVLTSSALVLVSRSPASTTFADAARESLGLMRFQLGISYDLGRPARPPAAVMEPPREEAPDTTSSPPR